MLGNRRSCGGQEPSGRSRLLCSGECELQRTCSGSTEFPLLHPRNEGLRALCIGTDKCWWLCIEGSSVWNTPHVAIGTNSHRRRGRCTSILAERPDASLESTTSNPPAGATCERCIPRSAARAARRSRRKRKSYYSSELGHEYLCRGDCTPFEYDGITRNKVFRFYSMFIKWYSVVIKCLLNGIR